MNALSIDDVLLSVMGMVPPLDVLRSFSLVCWKWRRVVLERDHWLALHTKTWRHPLQYAGDVPLHVYFCARLHVETVALPLAFNPKFRDNLKFGKYSKWAMRAPGVEFMKTIAWAVRVVGTFSTPLYCFEGHKPYQAAASSNSGVGDGWYTSQSDAKNYVLSPQAMVGMVLLKRASWFDNLSPYDVVEDVAVAFPEEASRATALDAMEYVRLLRFIASHPDTFEGLIWDCDGIVCRNVENMMGSEEELTLPLLQTAYRLEFHRYDHPHPRQIPHTFNIIRLCEHAARQK